LSGCLFRWDAVERRGDEIFLLLFVQCGDTRGRRGSTRTTGVQQFVFHVQRQLQTMTDLVPAALILRLFLAPNDLARIRKQGYALSIGQRTDGAVGIAAPYFNVDGAVGGDLIMTVPASRYKPRMAGPITAALRSKAAELSRKLGFNERARVVS